MKSQSKKQLFDLLITVDGITLTDWQSVMDLAKGIGVGDYIVISKEWCDNFKSKNPDYYKLDLSDLKTWSTFDRTCVELDFFYTEGQLMCVANIWNGDSFNGRRKDKRFKALIHLVKVPDSVVSKLDQHINYKLRRLAEQAYEEHLLSVESEWIRNFEKEMKAISHK